MANIMLISHPFGLSTDALHHFDLRKGICLLPPFYYKAVGGSENCTITEDHCTEYLKDLKMNDDETNVIVPHLEQLDQQSLQYKITLLFVNKLLSPNGNFLFTSVNLFQYLKGFGFTEEDFSTKFDGHLKDTSKTFIFYPSGYAAVIIITLPEDEKESQYAIQVRSNANVKAYQVLHQENLTEDSKKLIVISVIGAVHQRKSKNSPYCDQCISNNLVIYKEDIEDDLKSWWKRLKELTKNFRIKYDVNFVKKTASRLVLYLGLTNDNFPSLRASDDERICKITLNAAQREILLFNSDPRKIIIGKRTKLSINHMTDKFCLKV